jgi:hypothetical protein
VHQSKELFACEFVTAKSRHTLEKKGFVLSQPFEKLIDSFSRVNGFECCCGLFVVRPWQALSMSAYEGVADSWIVSPRM